VRNSGITRGLGKLPNIEVSQIEGVRLTQISSVADSRGNFIKILPSVFFQNTLDSVAYSTNLRAGTIRGIHFQIEPNSEEKIITCVQGSTFEVVIDIRPDSESFGGIATFELSQENGKQVYLPRGIAHGFQTLVDDTILQYCLTAKYSPESSYSIDPFGDTGIRWPMEDYSISTRDSSGVSFSFAAQKYAESLWR